jgi:hypothetical protein
MLLLNKIRDNSNTEYNLFNFVDATIQQVKEKLFGLINIPPNILHPRLVTIYINNRLAEKGYIYNYLDSNELATTLPVILQFKTIRDILSNINIAQELEDFNNGNNSFFEECKKIFIELTEEDYLFSLKFSLFVKDPVFFGSYRNDIEQELNGYLLQKDKYSKKYSEIDKQFNKVYEISQIPTDIIESFDIKTMNMNLVTATKEKYNFSSLFNSLELSETIPFIATTLIGQKQPTIRVYNRIFENSIITEKEFKSWFLNEKKKTNVTTYKKIKSNLFLKYKYENYFLSVNFFNNGQITISFLTTSTTSSSNLTYDACKTLLFNAMKNLIILVNKYSDQFTLPTLTSDSDLLNFSFSNITISTITSKRISKPQFESIIKKNIINKYIFEPKDTISQDILSFYYKKYEAKSEDAEERKGITVNLQDNPEKLDSSLITINLANSYKQILVILMYIQSLSNLQEAESELTFDESDEQVLKPKSNIKQLKEMGVKVLSTNCQKQRQPIIGENDPISGAYELIFNNTKYTCQNPDYPYPGFTNENIICCFKKDQRRKEPYFRNMRSQILEVLVQPSNFIITVDGNQTLAIKTTNQQADEHTYHFIDIDLNLVPITNTNLINQLNEEENIWLEPVSLSKLITAPPKNKCNFPPDFEKKTSNNIHSVCEHNLSKPFFGYNLNSFPCCFDKERNPIITRKRKDLDVLKQHIITTDKILESGRLGIIPNTVAQAASNVRDSSFYRMGVIQNKSSLLNVLNTALTSDSTHITREYLANQVPDYFLMLNAQHTFTEKEFVHYILNNEWKLEYIQDFLSKIFKVNMFILDQQANETRMVCNEFIQFDKSNPFVIILKRQNQYELIVEVKTDDNGQDVIKTFDASDPLINLFYDFFTQSCVIENKYPLTFGFDIPLDASVFLKKLKDRVRYQVANQFNQINYLVIDDNIPIPIYERGILENIPLETTLPTVQLNDLVNTYSEINQLMSKDNLKPILSIKTQIVDKNDTLVGILTNSGLYIPVSGTIIPTLEKSSTIYNNLDIDKNIILSNQPNFNYIDPQILFTKEKELMDNVIYKMKKFIGIVCKTRKDYFTFFKNVIQSKSMSLQEKYKILSIGLDKLFQKYIYIQADAQLIESGMSFNSDKQCLVHLNETSCDMDNLCKWSNTNNRCLIKMDNKLYNLCKGIVSNELITDTTLKIISDQIPKLIISEMKESESILKNISDIRKFVKQRVVEE